MLVYLATTNQGKVREFRALCSPAGWEVRTFAGYREPSEGDASYEANAVLKARTLVAQLREAEEPFALVLGDDSGIEVDALGGRPGVLSARYGGDAASWADRRRMLIGEVNAAGGSRDARFVCVVYCIDTTDRAWTSEGVVDGTIVDTERGDGGFSYDAIFYYPPAARTFAELSEDEKNRVSHRGLAVGHLIAAVDARETGRGDRI